MCILNNGHGEGLVEFGLAGVFDARILFSCEFTGDHQWKITEFRLPVSDVRVTLGRDGTWGVTDPHGFVSRPSRKAGNEEKPNGKVEPSANPGEKGKRE